MGHVPSQDKNQRPRGGRKFPIPCFTFRGGTFLARFRVWLECFNRKTDEQEQTASYVGTVRRSNPEQERFNMWLQFQFTHHFNTEQCIVDQ